MPKKPKKPKKTSIRDRWEQDEKSGDDFKVIKKKKPKKPNTKK